MGAALCRVLRDQVSQKDQDTDAKLERLLNKVEELSEKIDKDWSPPCAKNGKEVLLFKVQSK